ncbi:MAG: hypothetical protein CMD62_06005 [Gammaproteobacteria bacterium]|nr:hypothetical protein [Gammaproteobacteria bacterium]
MINFIIDHSRLIVGICLILFGFSTIPVSFVILETSETTISLATYFDYFIWSVASVYILSGVLFTMFGTSLIVNYTRH